MIAKLGSLIFTVCMFLVVSNAHAGYPVSKKDKHEKQEKASCLDGAETDITKVLDKDLKVQKGSKKIRGDYRAGGGGWGIASLACAIVGIFFPLLIIPAIVFGALGINKRNRGLAIAGLVIGITALLIYLLIFLIVASWVAVFS